MTTRTSSSPHDALPQPILLASAGLAAITVVVLGAVGLRSLLGGSTGEGGPRGATSAAVAPPGAPSNDASEAAPPGAEEARDVRARIDKELRMGRFKEFAADLELLLRLDPEAGNDRKLRVGVIETLMIVMKGAEPIADKLFDTLEKRMGPVGIDVLYELVTTRGGSRASERAGDRLREDAVRARGSEALRVAYDLRTAPCASKKELFGKAKEQGDKRAHDELVKLKTCQSSPKCCLYAKDNELVAAMDAIEARRR